MSNAENTSNETTPIETNLVKEFFASKGLSEADYEFFVATKHAEEQAKERAYVDQVEKEGESIIARLKENEDVLDIVREFVLSTSARAPRQQRQTNPANTGAKMRTLDCSNASCPLPNKQWTAPSVKGRKPDLCPQCRETLGRPAPAKPNKPAKMRALDKHDFGSQGVPKNLAEAKFRLKHDKNETRTAAVNYWIQHVRGKVGRSPTVRHPASNVGRAFREKHATETPKAASAY